VRLRELLTRYQGAVAADLAEVYGLDLEVLYRSRRWRYLLSLIDELPEASRVRQAMLDDPEVAEAILDADGGTDAEWHPPISEYGLAEQYLAQIIDGLAALNQAVVALGGGKPERPKATPRPRTQIDVVRERRSAETQADIIRLFAPHAAK